MNKWKMQLCCFKIIMLIYSMFLTYSLYSLETKWRDGKFIRFYIMNINNIKEGIIIQKN